MRPTLQQMGIVGSRWLRGQASQWLPLQGERSRLKGIYTLIFELGKGTDCKIGNLGSFCFNRGVYVYTGSGRGVASTSIEGRIKRHLGRRKRKFWHIDYLLSLRTCSVCASVCSETTKDVECRVNRRIQELTCGVFPVNGFGSSDCSCIGHLVYLPSHDSNRALCSVMKAYRKLRLKPQASRFN